jgi:hypothetical protein
MFNATREAVEAFSSQFSVEGDHIVYRRGVKGAPVRVSAEERDRFIASFKRSYRYVVWSCAVGLVAVVLGITTYALMQGWQLSELQITAITATPLAPMLIGLFWIWNAPARALDGRAQLGRPLSRDEFQRRAFARMPWINFLIMPPMMGLLYLKVTGGTALLSGWNALWSGLLVLFSVFLVIQAWRKWRWSRPAD